MQITNRGGVVQSWKLKKYLTDDKPPQPLELVNIPAAQTNRRLAAFFCARRFRRGTKSQHGALSKYKPSRKQGSTLQAPAEITLHWSDGHLDFVKHLKFDESYIVDLEATASVDGHLLPAAIGWRGGFGDVAVEKQSQGVGVFYNENGKLNVLQLKKAGHARSSGNPLRAARQLRLCRHRRSILHRRIPAQ